ncbi:MA2A1 mannosidase, partial [Polypterus senegalus]
MGFSRELHLAVHIQERMTTPSGQLGFFMVHLPEGTGAKCPCLAFALRLIERGQLEIATGGWVMTDEASAHYFGMIDQLLEGHQWLEKNLGVKPVTGWAVDPFGHSSTMAYILKRSGFSNMLIQRVHYSVKKHFSIHKTLEFFWRQNWDEGSSTDILCHMMPFYSYDVPHTCGPDPKICCQFDFKRLPGGRISCPWRVPPEAIHDGNVQHRAAEIIYSFALASVKKFSKMEVFPSSENYKMLTEARRNLGLFQHHDAITGTGKDWVVVDYGTRSLVVYNPTEQERTAVVTVYVDSPKVKVATLLGQPVMGQISAVWEETATISAEAYQVSFVTQLPALGLKVYQLAQGTDVNVLLADYNLYKMGEAIPVNSNSAFKVNVMQSNPMNYIIENSHLKIWCSGSSGLMEKIRLKETGKELNVKVEFVWYGTTSNRDKSGAYLFLPDGEAKPYSSSGSPIITVTTGAVFSEVTSTYHHFTHTVRVYNIQGVEGQSVEMCNTVDIRGEFNREIAMRITSDVNSNDRFFTDLNGFQIQPRRTLGTLPLQANFYPLTTMAYIQDEQVRLTLHSAQSLGVASLRSGQLEVIMDRRLMQDDNRGLGQGVQDNKVTANLFRLLLEERVRLDKTENSKPTSFPSLLSHMSSLYLNHPVIPMAVSHDFSTSHLLPAFSPLTSSMPCDVHVVNLRTIQSNIAIERLFNELKVQRFVPASLSLMYTASEGMNSSSIQLEPMEISTFRIQLT